MCVRTHGNLDMKTVKLKAKTKDYLWGGHKLFDYGKEGNDIIAESWELSFFEGMESLIDSGSDKGKKLSEVVTEKELGSNIKKYQFFPMLAKLIDSNQDLSIQVHPNDEYARKYENSYGKNEMWYVVDSDEGAMFYIGFNKDVSKEEIEKRIENNTLVDVMNHILVHPGDAYYIPAGTIHAIGKGCLIFEIQQNSNITYRVYDYGRRDKNGNLRELHVKKALDVLNLKKMEPYNMRNESEIRNKPFFAKEEENLISVKATKESFKAMTVLSGEGFVDDIPFKKGDTFFIPAGEEAIIKGNIRVYLYSIDE